MIMMHLKNQVFYKIFELAYELKQKLSYKTVSVTSVLSIIDLK